MQHGYKNPFEGFNNFVFMANFAGSTKHEVDKINTVIKKELSSFVEIKESSLIKTDQKVLIISILVV